VGQEKIPDWVLRGFTRLPIFVPEMQFDI